MEKVLFYGNDWGDFKSYSEFFAKMEMEGFEVAVATSNEELLPLLSTGKLLVVNHETYFYDLLIHPDGRKPRFAQGDCLSLSELREVFA